MKNKVDDDLWPGQTESRESGSRVDSLIELTFEAPWGWRRLAISSFEIPLLSQESGERGGIREPVVIVRAHHLCARMRGVLVIRDEWDVSCWQHVRNYVFFKAS